MEKEKIFIPSRHGYVQRVIKKTEVKGRYPDLNDDREIVTIEAVLVGHYDDREAQQIIRKKYPGFVVDELENTQDTYVMTQEEFYTHASIIERD